MGSKTNDRTSSVMISRNASIAFRLEMKAARSQLMSVGSWVGNFTPTFRKCVDAECSSKISGCFSFGFLNLNSGRVRDAIDGIKGRALFDLSAGRRLGRYWG